MLLAKFIEGFIFGIKKKTNRVDDESRGEELLILADQVSTGIKEVEEKLNQAPVIQEENGSDEKEDADAVVSREPENSLDEEMILEIGGEQTRWWLGVKEEEKKKEKEEEKEEEEEEGEEDS